MDEYLCVRDALRKISKALDIVDCGYPSIQKLNAWYDHDSTMSKVSDTDF